MIGDFLPFFNGVLLSDFKCVQDRLSRVKSTECSAAYQVGEKVLDFMYLHIYTCVSQPGKLPIVVQIVEKESSALWKGETGLMAAGAGGL